MHCRDVTIIRILGVLVAWHLVLAWHQWCVFWQWHAMGGAWMSHTFSPPFGSCRLVGQQHTFLQIFVRFCFWSVFTSAMIWIYLAACMHASIHPCPCSGVLGLEAVAIYGSLYTFPAICTHINKKLVGSGFGNGDFEVRSSMMLLLC